MNYTMSIHPEQMKLIKEEARRLSISCASYIKMKVLNDLKAEEEKKAE
jgi:hypothetical protein